MKGVFRLDLTVQRGGKRVTSELGDDETNVEGERVAKRATAGRTER